MAERLETATRTGSLPSSLLIVTADRSRSNVFSGASTSCPSRCLENGSIAVLRVYVILDARSSPEPPLGDAVETFIRREDAERFVEDVRGDEPELAGYLRIEER